MPHVIQPLMFNTVDGKKPAPVGKFSPEDFLYTRYWMLSQQDILLYNLAFFYEVCAARDMYIRKKSSIVMYVCGKYAQKSWMPNV